MIREDIYDEKNKIYTCISCGQEYENRIWEYISCGYDGSNIKVGIIDSGIIQNHPIIKKLNIVKTRDFTGEGIEDKTGHGTLVTLCATYNGLIKTKLYIAKVLDEDNECSEENVIKALEWLKDCKVDSINMSIGFEKEEKCDGTCIVCKKIEEISKKNISIFVSAGNNPNKYFCPATSDYTISVGALNDEKNGIASYSAKADFYAPCPKVYKFREK